MFAALEIVFKYLIINYKVKVIWAMPNLRKDEVFELKYSFLKSTVENVT